MVLPPYHQGAPTRFLQSSQKSGLDKHGIDLGKLIAFFNLQAEGVTIFKFIFMSYAEAAADAKAYNWILTQPQKTQSIQSSLLIFCRQAKPNLSQPHPTPPPLFPASDRRPYAVQKHGCSLAQPKRRQDQSNHDATQTTDKDQ